MLRKLFADLDTVAWDDWRAAHALVERFLLCLWREPARLCESLGDFIAAIEAPRITRTAELSSWDLHRGQVYDVKLNQFLPSALTGRSSEGIHHHTRPLTALTLCGGYQQDYYLPGKDAEAYQEGEAFETAMWAERGPNTSPGHVYTIGPDTFHAIREFEDETMTLAVYGKIVRDQITVFNTVTGLVEKRTTCRYAKPRMVNALMRLAQPVDGPDPFLG